MPVPQTLLAALLLVVPLGAQAQTPPVVLELFTSQGCSSCPPADALLTELAAREDVIALALHVDYWDYLGWKDSFGKPAHTARQRAYAKAARSRSIYTPEMVVQGEDRLIGHDAAKIEARIAAHRSASRAGIAWICAATATSWSSRSPRSAIRSGPRRCTWCASCRPTMVAIEAGENAGHEITYTNIVTDWDTIARWDGESAVELRAQAGDGPVAVIVQKTTWDRS